MERDMRMPGELFCRLPGQGIPGGINPAPRCGGVNRRGCVTQNKDMPDGCAAPRRENVPGGMGSCGMVEGEIGNPHPCGENGVTGRSLAMVYASVQSWQGLYDPKTALTRGTLFRELDLPLVGGGPGMKGGIGCGC